jgi:hypothetical protein
LPKTTGGPSGREPRRREGRPKKKGKKTTSPKKKQAGQKTTNRKKYNAIFEHLSLRGVQKQRNSFLPKTICRKLLTKKSRQEIARFKQLFLSCVFKRFLPTKIRLPSEANGSAASEANGSAAHEANGSAASEANGSAASETNGSAASEANESAASEANGSTAYDANESAASEASGANGGFHQKKSKTRALKILFAFFKRGSS